MLRSILALVAAIALGVLVTAQIGLAMFDPIFSFPFACLIGFATGQTAAAGARIQRTVTVALLFIAVVNAVGLALVNLDPPHDRLPDWQSALGIFICGASAAFLAASIATVLLRKFSNAKVKWMLRGVMLALLCLYLAMPSSWAIAAEHTLENNGPMGAALAVAAAFVASGMALLSMRIGAPPKKEEAATSD